MADDGVGQLLALSRIWFPGREPDEESMGAALWREKDFWEKMSLAVASGISKAFRG